MPEGYFVGENLNINVYAVFVMFFCAICVLIADRIWAKFGKDDVVVETVEFYPPEEYNSAEIGYIYNGSADTKSIVSLLVYLADKGYLKIEETEEEGIFSKKKGFKITKIKEYDGKNEYEKLFFKGLFKFKTKELNTAKAREIIKEAKRNGEKISFAEALDLASTEKIGRVSVTASDLYDNFYTTINKIKTKLETKENKNKIFESASSGKGKWLILMIIAIYILITVKPIMEYGESEAFLFTLIFPMIGFAIFFAVILGILKIPKLFAFTHGLMFGGVPWAVLVLPALLEEPIYLVMNILGLVCMAVIMVFIKLMPKRTKYGNEMLGKIRGFKNFLEIAEKEQLEELVTENPEYFYHILPYTYALGISDVWMQQFETIAMQAPSWYYGYTTFNPHDFNRFLNSTMSSAQSAMVSSPSGSSGGSSGGFSSRWRW